jgi:hypothetical protein
VEDAQGTAYADEDDSCSFCLDLFAKCSGYSFDVVVPDGTEGLTITTQAFELGDDPDDHPPPISASIDGPIHDDVDIGMVPI